MRIGPSGRGPLAPANLDDEGGMSVAATGSLATRPLGRTGMEITRVGFGAWAVGGGEWSFGWGAQDDEESIASIRHAVESGVNWVDTAAVYGLGHSEEVVAAALEAYPDSDRPYVFTKCGLRWVRRIPWLRPAGSGAPTRSARRWGTRSAGCGPRGSTSTRCTGP